ncbi:MAG: hypothetical protein K8T25_00655 [Planctomycetia bacterium]|nr:hypothetical protein [Planctomycetia bacterium]
MMALRKTLCGLALGSLAAFAGSRTSEALAADLAWQSGQQAAPAAYQEPIGGRIDPWRNDSQVRPVSSMEERPAPEDLSPDAPRSERPVRRPTRPAARPTYRVAAAPQQSQYSAAPWQGRPGTQPAGVQAQPSYAPPVNGGYRIAARPSRMQPEAVEEVQPGEEIVQPGEAVPPGTVMDDGTVIEGDDRGMGEGFVPEGGDDNCDGRCWMFRCPKCPPGCIPAPEWPNDIDIIGGVQGFKGPIDQGRAGNFGFHEGFNVGGPLWLVNFLGWQAGGNWTQNNFNGDQSTGVYRTDSRQQVFATAGLFSRPGCFPIQGGVVIDWLHEDYGVEYDLTQVRAELSYVGCWAEIGFMGAFHMKTQDVDFREESSRFEGLVKLQSVDQYCLFLRRKFDNCGEGRIWGGVTENGDGIVGSDFRVPISNSFLIQGSFNYLIASDNGQNGQQAESWGLGLELVFQPFCRARKSMSDPYRPLFNVADNARMFVEPKEN